MPTFPARKAAQALALASLVFGTQLAAQQQRTRSASSLGLAPAMTVEAAVAQSVSGVVTLQVPGGSTVALFPGQAVSVGSVLRTERDSRAVLRFTDGGVVVLRPDSELKLDQYRYDRQKPARSSFVMSLVRGGLRSISGLLGKANRDAYQLKTPTVTIGIRGTDYVARICDATCMAEQRNATPKDVPVVARVGGVEGRALASGYMGLTTRRLKAGEPVYRGELLRTTAGAALTLVMPDDGRLLLTPGTQLRIDRFDFDPARPAAAEVRIKLLAGTVYGKTGHIKAARDTGYRIFNDRGGMETRGTGFSVSGCIGGVCGTVSGSVDENGASGSASVSDGENSARASGSAGSGGVTGSASVNGDDDGPSGDPVRQFKSTAEDFREQAQQAAENFQGGGQQGGVGGGSPVPAEFSEYYDGLSPAGRVAFAAGCGMAGGGDLGCGLGGVLAAEAQRKGDKVAPAVVAQVVSLALAGGDQVRGLFGGDDRRVNSAEDAAVVAAFAAGFAVGGAANPLAGVLGGVAAATATRQLVDADGNSQLSSQEQQQIQQLGTAVAGSVTAALASGNQHAVDVFTGGDGRVDTPEDAVVLLAFAGGFSMGAVASPVVGIAGGLALAEVTRQVVGSDGDSVVSQAEQQRLNAAQAAVEAPLRGALAAISNEANRVFTGGDGRVDTAEDAAVLVAFAGGFSVGAVLDPLTGVVGGIVAATAARELVSADSNSQLSSQEQQQIQQLGPSVATAVSSTLESGNQHAVDVFTGGDGRVDTPEDAAVLLGFAGGFTVGGAVNPLAGMVMGLIQAEVVREVVGDDSNSSVSPAEQARINAAQDRMEAPLRETLVAMGDEASRVFTGGDGRVDTPEDAAVLTAFGGGFSVGAVLDPLTGVVAGIVAATAARDLVSADSNGQLSAQERQQIQQLGTAAADGVSAALASGNQHALEVFTGGDGRVDTPEDFAVLAAFAVGFTAGGVLNPALGIAAGLAAAQVTRVALADGVISPQEQAQIDAASAPAASTGEPPAPQQAKGDRSAAPATRLAGSLGLSSAVGQSFAQQENLFQQMSETGGLAVSVFEGAVQTFDGKGGGRRVETGQSVVFRPGEIVMADNSAAAQARFAAAAGRLEQPDFARVYQADYGTVTGEGLYLAVADGLVTASNDKGRQNFSAGEAGYAGAGRAPERLASPPAFLGNDPFLALPVQTVGAGCAPSSGKGTPAAARSATADKLAYAGPAGVQKTRDLSGARDVKVFDDVPAVDDAKSQPGNAGNRLFQDVISKDNAGKGGEQPKPKFAPSSTRHSHTFGSERRGLDGAPAGNPLFDPADNLGGGGNGGKLSSGTDPNAPTETAEEQQLGGNPTDVIGDMLKTEGGTPSGDVNRDLAELAYAQSVGSDGYAATKNMSAEERQNYWSRQADAQRSGKTRPREDDNPSGQGEAVPFGTPDMQRRQLVLIGRAAAAGKGAQLGGAGDGRGDRDSGGSGGGMMLGRQEQLGVARELGGGTINWDQVLGINQLVNPASGL